MNTDDTNKSCACGPACGCKTEAASCPCGENCACGPVCNCATQARSCGCAD